MMGTRKTTILVGNHPAAKTNPGVEVDLEYVTHEGKMFISAESLLAVAAIGKLDPARLLTVKQQAERRAQQEHEAASA
jgi:hypothetical protein